MTGVTHGADADRLSTIATQIIDSASRTRDIATTGSMQLTVLAESWQGPDVEHFIHEWDAASRSIGQAADGLDRVAAELQRQADEQTQGSTPVRGVGGGGAEVSNPEPDDGGSGDGSTGGTPGSADGGFVGAVLDAARRLMDKFNITPLPDGLDYDDPVVREMQQTPEGREMLTWLAEHDIKVSPGAGATEYDPTTDTIYLSDDTDPTSVIHEGTHAQQDVEGRSPDPKEVDRDTYVAGQIDGEVDAVVAEIEYLESAAEDPTTIDDTAYDAYTEAESAALEDGASAEEAREAGRDAVRELFYDGTFETGNTGESYEEYYGRAWDRINS